MKFIRFSELAQAYFPGCNTAENAVRCLSREIKRCKSLFVKLQETGYKPYSHRVLSPKQLEIIFKELGNPYENLY